MKILLEQNFKSEFDLSNEEYVFGHEDGQQDISLFQASMGNALFTCKHLAFHAEGSTLEIQWNDKTMTFQFREKVDS